MSYERTTPCGQIAGCGCQWPGVAAYKGIRYATAGRWGIPPAPSPTGTAFTRPPPTARPAFSRAAFTTRPRCRKKPSITTNSAKANT